MSDAGAPARSTILPRPTSAGSAVALGWVAAALLSGSRTVAVGFLLPLTLLALVDFLIAVATLHQRPVTAAPRNRLASAPDETITVGLSAPTGFGPLEVVVRRFSALTEDADDVVLGPDDTEVTVDMPSDHAYARMHIRYRVSSSYIGLVRAFRYEVQPIALTQLGMLSPTEESLALPEATEIARLREYVPGDRMGRVAWATTARTGHLHVRDDTTGDDDVTVVVDGGSVADLIAVRDDGTIRVYELQRRTAQVVRSLIKDGRSVRLVTVETRPKFYEDHRDLAMSDPSRWFSPPNPHEPASDGLPTLVTRNQIVVDEYDLKRRVAASEGLTPDYVVQGPAVIVTLDGVEVRR